MPLIFSALLALISAGAMLSYPTYSAQKAIQGAAEAVNFQIYQRALANYVALNAPVSGTIPDSALSFPPNYSRHSTYGTYSNVVSSGVLYTWQPGTWTSLPGFAKSLYQSNQYSVGQVTASGNILTKQGVLTVPTSIPVGSLVVVGT